MACSNACGPSVRVFAAPGRDLFVERKVSVFCDDAVLYRFYIYRTIRPFFHQDFRRRFQRDWLQKMGQEKKRRRIARYHAPGIPLRYEISLASRKSTHRHPIPRASHPNHPPEARGEDRAGGVKGGRKRGAGDMAGWREGEMRVDSAWISHVSMEQGTLMSTYLRWLGSTHL